MPTNKHISGKLTRPGLTPEAALRKLISLDGGVFASADVNYNNAIFGRDSLEIAQDLLLVNPKLSRAIILNVAQLQGVEYNLVNEEEPGRIHHEHRQAQFNGRNISASSRAILKQLSAKWGGTDKAVTYYGSIDATPLFIKLIGEYVDRYGKAILKETISDRNNQLISIEESVLRAIEWLVRRLEKSQVGMLESFSTNPEGIKNQVWKDSKEFYVHPSGQKVNHHFGVISIETQALAYDALLTGAKLFRKRSKRLNQLAQRLRLQVFKRFWLPKQQYFALGIDYTKEQKPRIIKTIAANAGAILDSHLLDGLTLKNKQKYLFGIVSMLFSPEFLTNAGIRSRALKHKGLIKYWDYHGSYAVWPKETNDIIRGLLRQGLIQLAIALRNRMMNAVQASGKYPEFIYVDSVGRVLNGQPVRFALKNPVIAESTNAPEHIQGWTVSAVLENKRLIKTNQTDKSLREFEKKILSRIPKIPRITSAAKLRQYYPPIRYKLKFPQDYEPLVKKSKKMRKRFVQLPVISIGR